MLDESATYHEKWAWCKLWKALAKRHRKVENAPLTRWRCRLRRRRRPQNANENAKCKFVKRPREKTGLGLSVVSCRRCSWAWMAARQSQSEFQAVIPSHSHTAVHLFTRTHVFRVYVWVWQLRQFRKSPSITNKTVKANSSAIHDSHSDWGLSRCTLPEYNKVHIIQLFTVTDIPYIICS